MLKFKIGSEDFDKLNDVEKTFYAMAGEGYQLQVEGAVDKGKLNEFRATNTELMKNQEAYKGVDLEKYRALEEQERKLRDKELIDKGEFDTLVAERTASIHSDYQVKLDNLTNQLAESSTSHNRLQSKYEIEGAATKAFVDHKISPDAYEAVLSQIKSKFIIDNGKVIAREGETILAGADGNLTVSEFVASQPEIFKIQSSGGKGTGSEGNNQMQKGASSQDKIKAGLAARM